jgi:hypothetical protein
MEVHVSARLLSFPPQCACCGAPPQVDYRITAVRVTGKRVVRTQSRYWEIPYCQNCMRHASLWPKPWGNFTWFMALITGLLWIPIQIFLDLSARNGARKLCSSSCCTAAPAAAYLSWDGTVHSFEFTSAPFAFEFILANRNRVLELTYQMQADIQQYLAGKQQPRTSVVTALNRSPPPQIANPAAVDEATVREALEKIEKAKGPIARRNALDAAIGRIASHEQRNRLLKEAARIEVHTVLDKVDSLKTSAAKRRHLEAALSQIRADSVPDELQTEEITLLEAALQELDGGPGA